MNYQLSQFKKKKTTNPIQLFSTFIERNCISSSYLKKNKSFIPLCHHQKITRPKLSCVPKSIVELKNFLQYNGQSLKIKTVNKTKATRLRCTYCMSVCVSVCICMLVFCTKINGWIICETHSKIWTCTFTPVWQPIQITFLSRCVSVSLSNPLLLPCTVDVVYGRSHRSFVVLLVRVCIRPLEWLGNSVVLHGSIAFPSCIRLSASDQLYSSINS